MFITNSRAVPEIKNFNFKVLQGFLTLFSYQLHSARLGGRVVKDGVGLNAEAGCRLGFQI